VKHFGKNPSLNLGIGGDRTENILWRLDHGALDGVSPKVIVLMIGVNNAPLVSANDVPATAVAHGMKLCVESLRLHCPDSHLVVLKILPAFDPTAASGQVIGEINTAFSSFDWKGNTGIDVLDLQPDFTRGDGSLKTELYSDGHLHLSPAGYEVIAARLRAAISTRLDP
jgi:platelet-activating factor acetylhydrolase IB subunit beta/gamma